MTPQARSAHPHPPGFTLIECMVGVAVLGTLVIIAAPAMSATLREVRVSAAANTLVASLQMARAEAVRRNSRVELVLTDDALTNGVENTAHPSTTGHNWLLRMPVQGSSNHYIRIAHQSGSEGLSFTAPMQASQAVVAFDGLGQTADGSLPSFTVGDCASTKPQCRRVIVPAGGKARVCTPTAPGASRAQRC